MARAHFVKAARKARPEHGIAVGDSYYWWQFRNSGKRYSKTPPKPSQLTQSEYFGTLYSIEEDFEMPDPLGDDATDEDRRLWLDDARSAFEDVQSNLDCLRDETQDKCSNVEDAFPNGSPTIDLLQERCDWLEDACSAIEDAISEIDSIADQFKEDSDDDEERDDWQTVVSQIEELWAGLDWCGS